MKLLPLLAGALLLTGCATAAPAATPATSSADAPTAFHGREPTQALTRPSFVLTDTGGRPYDFAAETGGRPTLLYFGYANCPDECPTALAGMAAALRQAPAELREQARLVFVTTDPGRDTGPVIRRFLDQFSTRVVGLTGTQAQVDAAQEATGFAAARRGGQTPTSPGAPDEHVHAEGTADHQHFGPLGYGVEHGDVIFAFDADNRMPVLYAGGARPSDIAVDLPLLASGDTS